jgi:hypothetical protein
MIDGYLKLLRRRTWPCPTATTTSWPRPKASARRLSARPLPSVACHCDPLCENFLDTGERMWIVDWEYSGMNDPMWDLGDLSVEGGFGPDQDEEMLAAYFGGPVPEADRARMVIYKAMCDLLWTLWGLIQLANGNPCADDFRAYADGRISSPAARRSRRAAMAATPPRRSASRRPRSRPRCRRSSTRDIEDIRFAKNRSGASPRRSGRR